MRVIAGILKDASYMKERSVSVSPCAPASFFHLHFCKVGGRLCPLQNLQALQ